MDLYVALMDVDGDDEKVNQLLRRCFVTGLGVSPEVEDGLHDPVRVVYEQPGLLCCVVDFLYGFLEFLLGLFELC